CLAAPSPSQPLWLLTWHLSHRSHWCTRSTLGLSRPWPWPSPSQLRQTR
ncbi:hypothetical protein HaLaN_33068, partial [Haematococcus lacustris]